MTETMRITNEVLDRHSIAVARPSIRCTRVDCAADLCGFECCDCICHRYPFADHEPGPNVSRQSRTRMPGLVAATICGEILLLVLDWRWWLAANIALGVIAAYLW